MKRASGSLDLNGVMVTVIFGVATFAVAVLLSTARDRVGVANSVLVLVVFVVAAYREDNGLADDARVPVDAVTSSASGLDPHISVANARLQAARVAAERNLDVARVLELIDDRTDGRALGFLGEPG